MNIKEILFGFDGRIARMQYFIYSIVTGAIAIFSFALLAAVLSSTAPDTVAIIACILIIATFIVYVWTAWALTIKRLHDIGLSGVHLIWITLLSFANGMLQATDPGVSALLGLASFGVSLWLLFAPGNTTENKYGPVPA